MIILYGIPNCDKIKKTRAALERAGADYRFHDYRKDGSPESLIKTFLKHFDYMDLINTRGTTWRKLPEVQRDNLRQPAAIKLMSTQPALIKRPLLQSDDDWLLGYDEARLRSLIGSA